MHPIIFQFGKFTIYSWGMMLALALIVSGFLLNRRFLEEKMDPDDLINLLFWCVFGGILGARFFYVVFYDWNYYSQHLLEIVWPKGGLSGLVWYGGLIGGFLSAFLYTRYKQLNFRHLADLFAPYLALAYAIVRIGCFLNGCCYGKACSLPWAVTFPAVDAVPRHPTQLYSSLLNFVIFTVLLRLYPRRRWNGQIFVTYLVLYSIYRFIVEFFRENLMIGQFLTIAQWISLAAFALGSCILLYKNHQPKNTVDK